MYKVTNHIRELTNITKEMFICTCFHEKGFQFLYNLMPSFYHVI